MLMRYYRRLGPTKAHTGPVEIYPALNTMARWVQQQPRSMHYVMRAGLDLVAAFPTECILYHRA